MSGRRHHQGTKQRKQTPETDILDRFSPTKFGKIIPTSTKKKKDAFRSFRPSRGECLDYEISQTVLRMDAGDTKINVTDTHASYTPAPPVIKTKKRKTKDLTPPLKFVNEIWMDQQNALQEKYRKDLRKTIKHQKAYKYLKTKNMHDFVLSMVGPEWFQELSPIQLRTVDKLECCILIDTKNNTITNVQENIGTLGLVLRPNHRHIKKALKLCCKNPVEFLLILYQLINPQRKEYSLNDRLLLSAVVHLTMTETLRELHVRIPSPPVYRKFKVEKPKIVKNITYASPYLEPHVFNLVPAEHTGDYVNPRIQYPESPYFAYISALPIERFISDDIFELDLNVLDPEEAELLEDMRKAQLIYDGVRNGERVKLLKPTVLKQCEDVLNFYNSLYGRNLQPLILPPLATLRDSEDEECFCHDIPLEDSDDTCCEYEITTCECQGKCECRKKSKRFTSPRCYGCVAREKKKHVLRVIKGVTVLPDGEVVPIIEATVLQETCDCLQKYKDNIVAVRARNNLKCQKATYIIAGVVMTKEGPVYILSTALKKTKKRVSVSVQQGEEPALETQSQNEHGKLEEINSSSCREMRKSSDRLECACKSSRKNERSTNTDADQSCTCKKDEDNTDDELSSPCDCEKCECKERSKMYTGPRCKICQEKQRQQYLERIITGMKETASHRIVPIIEGTRLLNCCDCLQCYVERILSMEARNKIQSQKAQFVIGGVVMTNIGPVYVLSTALLSRKDNSCKPKRKRSLVVEKKEAPEEEEEETDEENLKYSGCKCKEELERFLQHKCTCEQCNVKERQEQATYIMGGTISRVDTDPVNIVQGVREQRCDCLEKYKEKIEKLEQYRRRIEVRYNLKSQSLKYSIGGVVNTPQGPVYVITGMRPPIECACAKALRQKEEEESHLQQMAKMPPTGRIKYQVAGVKHTPEGNVFIISQALAIDDCDCVKLFDTYAQAHKACLDAYESFLQQTHEELDQYMAEMAERYPRSESGDGEVTEYTEQAWDESVPKTDENELESSEEDEPVKAIDVKCEGQKRNICGRGEASSGDESILSPCECQEDDEDDDDETSRESSEESQTCPSICLDSFKKSNIVESEPDTKVNRRDETPELKRFVILKKMPCDTKKQVNIVKQVLSKMAEDGFPLAKLPDCHKLPHFKLWMQLRCGKFWRQKDIDAYEPFSKKGWNHTGACKIQVTPPNLGIDKKRAVQLTWKHAAYVKKLVGEKTDLYYRETGQKAVDRAREFFPMTYSYEFPNKTFRDVYFAYLPSKEKDTYAFRITKPSDARIILKKYSCYC